MLDHRFALALLSGIVVCLWLPYLPDTWLLGCAAAIVPLAAWMRGGNRFVAIAASGFLLAALHAWLGMSRQLPLPMEHRQVELTGTVSDLPQHEVRRTRFVLKIDDADAIPEALRGRRVRLAWYDEFGTDASPQDAARFRIAAGSRWKLSAKLRAPRGLRNPGGVDIEKHALIDRIVATGYVRNPQFAREVSKPRGLDAWREAMSARIAVAVPQSSSPTNVKNA